jgi:2-polyprenyl-6-methoxyphenol hydroxylase-like FAD-dependent oxidoreductase
MSLHVIVGAGPVGTATARLLAGRGERVRVVPRRGTGPEHAAIERVAADANDAARLSALAAGAVALFFRRGVSWTRPSGCAHGTYANSALS